MDKIELKYLSGYLPYQLKCQYLGITNGSEISKKRREYEKENQPYTNWSYFEEIDFEYGLKIGFLKEIKIFKDYWKCFIGIKHTGLKSFYNGANFKPILRPMSDLNKEIEFNGEKFRPFYQMRVELHHEINQTDYQCLLSEKLTIENESESKYDVLKFSLQELEKLYKWHFDVHDLISSGLEIDINTI